MRGPDAPLTARLQLRRQWRLAGAWSVPFIGGGVWLLLEHAGRAAALQGGLQTAAVLVYGWMRWGRALELNHPPQEERLLPSLGAANWLTLLRGGLIAVLAGFVFQPALVGARLTGWIAWAPAAVYITAAALDLADGFLARVTASETRLGEHLDTEIDALGLLIAGFLIVWMGKAPAAYLCVGVGYYALQAAVGSRRKSGRPIAPRRPRTDARLLAGCEMGFAGAALLPLFEPAATRPVALILTAALLVGFVRDWLVVCGYATPDGRPLSSGVQRVDRAIARCLPIVLRAAAVAGLVVLVGRFAAGEYAASLSPAGCALLGTCATLLAFGVMTRLAGLAASVTAARAMAGPIPGLEWELVLDCGVALIMTGAGDLKLWQPEDRFFMKRIGGHAPFGPRAFIPIDSDMPEDPHTTISRRGPIRSLVDLGAGLADAARFRMKHGRPFVVLSYAQSVDGSIAGRNRERIQLSCPESMALTHGIRALCDGILIGIGTLLSDDPLLTVTHACGPHPQPVVLDTHLRTPLDARLVQRPDARPWIIHKPGLPESRAQALRAAGAEPMPCGAGTDGWIDLPSAMALLAERQVNRLMVEGGARVITSFVRQKVADLFIITISPQFVGGLPVLDAGAAGGAIQLQFEEAFYQTMGRDLVLWARPWWAPS